MRLRPYQKKAIVDINDSLKKCSSVLLEAATASGKRVVFCQMAKDYSKQKKRVIIIVHTRELFRQVTKNLDHLKVKYGRISSRIEETPENFVQVAMIKTLYNRMKNINYTADIVIVDEAQHSLASHWFKVLEYFKSIDSKRIGFTATPFRLDGRGLGACFEKLIRVSNWQDLTKAKYLAPFSIYAPENLRLDLSRIRIIGGDYSQKQLEKAINKPFISGRAIEHYKKYSAGKSALVFCISIKHAKMVAKEFEKAGISAKAAWGMMPVGDRKKFLEDFSKGKLKVITSVDILVEGFDVPKTESIIQLRPTKSLTRYLQMIGRGARPYKGKKEFKVIDSVANVYEFGFPDENREISLLGVSGSTSIVVNCPKCHHVHVPLDRCPKCGFKYKGRHGEKRGTQPRKIIQAPGYLKKLERQQIVLKNKARKTEFQSCNTYEDFYNFSIKYGYINPKQFAKQMRAKVEKEKIKNILKESERFCGSCLRIRKKTDFAKASHRCKECQQTYKKKSYSHNKEKEKKSARDWARANPGKHRETKKLSFSKALKSGKPWAAYRYSNKKGEYNKRHYEKYRERERARSRAYKEKNKYKIAAYKKQYREKKMLVIRDKILKPDFYIPKVGEKLRSLETLAQETLFKLIEDRKNKRLKK